MFLYPVPSAFSLLSYNLLVRIALKRLAFTWKVIGEVWYREYILLKSIPEIPQTLYYITKFLKKMTVASYAM